MREDYSEVLYEVGRLEDSMRAARQLVTLDPYFGIGWNRILRVAVALDRRAEVEEAVRQLRAIAPGTSSASSRSSITQWRTDGPMKRGPRSRKL